MKKGILFSVITAILFVTLEPVSKLIANDVNPYAITFWRFLIGAVIILPFAVNKMKKNNIKADLKDFAFISLWGVVLVCISMISLQIAVKMADSPSIIAITFSSNSIFTIIFAVLILKEKFTKNKIIALVLGIIGVIFCADFSSGTNLESVLLALFSAVSFSLYTVQSRKYVKKYGSFVQSGLGFFAGSIVLLIALVILGVDVTPSVTPNVVINLCYLGIFITGIGYICYFVAIEKGGAIMASLAFFIKPILTPFVALAVNNIVPDYKVFLAVIFIVGASYFATYKKEKVK